MATKSVLDKFVIESISIESFRGYNHPHSFTFKEPVNVFFGKNGYGKSSTLYAIEWCLFGRVEFLPQLEGKARDEIVNQSNLKGIAKVKMALRRGKEEVTIERTKAVGKANTTFAITTNEGDFEDEDAEKKFFLLFGMTLEDFIRAVYLHQEGIRALLTDKIADRDEALDRLFGLETMRNIVAGIPIKKIKDKIDNLEQKKAGLTKKIEGAVTLCQNDLGKLRKNATDAGLSENDIELAFATTNAKAIIKEIEDIAKDYASEKFDIDQPTSLEDFPSFERKVKYAIKESEKQSVDQSRIVDLGTKKRRFQELSDAAAEEEKPIEERRKQIREIVNSEGDAETIGRKISDLDGQLAAEGKKRDSLDINSKLIQDAIASLKILTESICPVCGQGINTPQVLHTLESQANSAIAQQMAEIDQKVSSLKVRKSKLDDLQTNLKNYSMKLAEVQAIQIKALEALSIELEVTEKDKIKLLAMADKEMTNCQEEINRLEESSRAKTTRFQNLRELFDSVILVTKVLDKEAEFGKLNKLFSADAQEIENIDMAISGLQKFEDDLTKIVKASGKVQTELAAEVISSSQKDVGSYYSNLCMHKHYDRMQIEVKSREVSGIVKNSYAIKASSKDGKETHVATRFSTGQMNCVALSVFFALTKSLPVKLGFLILDDPSQNLDPDHKNALADIISTISSERQIFISTQDKEFKDSLKARNKTCKIHEFVGWDASGPKLL